MKAQNFAGLRPIHLYMPGDLLLEQERLAASGPVVLNVLGGGAPVPEPPGTYRVLQKRGITYAVFRFVS